jgi:Mg-chelatase subunit ChlD
MLKKVHISIVLDRSGSMEDARSDAVGAVNRYLGQVRADTAIDARLSLVIFDSQSIDTIRDRQPVSQCPDLTLDEYQPRGSTPLLDAVGYSVGILDCLSDPSERRIMAILTDGLENASRDYTREKLRALLDRKQAEGWLILYLGAGHDSWGQAQQIGIRAGHTADFSMPAMGETADVLHAVGRRFLFGKSSPAHAITSLTPDERARLLSGTRPTDRSTRAPG